MLTFKNVINWYCALCFSKSVNVKLSNKKEHVLFQFLQVCTLIFREQMSSFCSQRDHEIHKGGTKKSQKKKINHVMIWADKSSLPKGLLYVRLSVGQSLDKVCVLRAKPKWSPKVPSKSFPLIWVTIGLLIESLRHSFINDSGFYRHTQKDWTKVTLSARQTPFFPALQWR